MRSSRKGLREQIGEGAASCPIFSAGVSERPSQVVLGAEQQHCFHTRGRAQVKLVQAADVLLRRTHTGSHAIYLKPPSEPWVFGPQLLAFFLFGFANHVFVPLCPYEALQLLRANGLNCRVGRHATHTQNLTRRQTEHKLCRSATAFQALKISGRAGQIHFQ